tara:strand:- start:306 stop:536 length:231 start_codon:yes stop_codon:yes gene_type:complete
MYKNDTTVILRLLADQTVKLSHAETQLNRAIQLLREFIRHDTDEVLGRNVPSVADGDGVMKEARRFLKTMEELNNE